MGSRFSGGLGVVGFAGFSGLLTLVIGWLGVLGSEEISTGCRWTLLDVGRMISGWIMLRIALI